MIISKKTKEDIDEINKVLRQTNYFEDIMLKNLDMEDMPLDNYIGVGDLNRINITDNKIRELYFDNIQTVTINNSEIEELTLSYTNKIVLSNHSHIKRLYISDCILWDFCKSDNSKIDKIIIRNVLYTGNNVNELFKDSVVEFDPHGYSNLQSIIPTEGSFIGYKKVRDINKDDVIVKLLIPKDAKRSSGSTRKCRASKVKVLDMYYMDDKNKKCKEAYNAFYRICENCSNDCMKCELTETQIFRLGTMYKIGEIIEADGFDDNRWNVCTQGIHFFITEEEAINYEI